MAKEVVLKDKKSPFPPQAEKEAKYKKAQDHGSAEGEPINMSGAEHKKRLKVAKKGGNWH